MPRQLTPFRCFLPFSTSLRPIMTLDADAVPYGDAYKIHFKERDITLRLDSPRWPNPKAVPREFGWKEGDDHLYRVIFEEEQRFLAGPIREALLRFPSASLNGLQRRQEYHVNLSESENLHTYRVFSHPECDPKKLRVRRIFLMHNGLNELDKMGLYYQLASKLISEDRETVCILRPFPGHLTRSPFQAFAETPLDRYLWDGSHLFRQFVRYMIETQWFLSVIVRRSQYRCPSGVDLLEESPNPSQSRLQLRPLALAMEFAWSSQYEASTEALEQARKGDQPETPTLKRQIPTRRFEDAIRSLRNVLCLEDTYRNLGSEIKKRDKEPALHVIGYSLGGFTAQSVFMSWPFLVASCSTLLSGGALRELAPTAFADPEEWQSVLHSLRYELDDAMMSGRYGRDDENVAGIDRDLFRTFTRTFYETFQQEYRGSFQTRLAAFRQRMLFVVGGNDPIVRPNTVLDSGPPDGINMLEIGALGHFLANKANDPEETKQRTFWLPEIARLIDHLSDRASEDLREELLVTWLDDQMQLPPPRKKDKVKGLTVEERLAVEGDGALPGDLFERCLDDLLARHESMRDSVLFILRNEVPTMLLDPLSIQERATMLNHDDDGIRNYTHGVLNRQQVLFTPDARISVILPWNVEQITKSIDAHPGFPSQAESSSGQMPIRPNGSKTWSAFLANCTKLTKKHPDGVRIFNWDPPLGKVKDPGANTIILLEAARSESQGESLQLVPSIPDCWIWMSKKFLLFSKDDEVTMESARGKLPEAVRHYALQDNDGRIDESLRQEDVRIVSVSRARYNPRFRGRIVANSTDVKKVLTHLALCVAASRPFSKCFSIDETNAHLDSDLDEPASRDRS
jgi:hypothetical protein